MPKIRRFTGINNATPPEAARPGDLQSASNVLVTDDGRLKRRPGRRKLFYDISTPNPSHSLAVVGGLIYFVTGGSLVRTGLDTDPPEFEAVGDPLGYSGFHMYYLYLNGKTYFSNKYDYGVIDMHGRHSWGVALPPVPTLGLSGSGTLPAGKYGISLTYVLEDGQESGASHPVDAAVVNGRLTISGIMASTDDRVTGIRLYSTTTDGEVVGGRGMYLVANLSNTDQTYVMSTPVGQGRMCNTVGMLPVPAGGPLCFYRGRIFFVIGNNIFYTERWNYELYKPDENFLPFQHSVNNMIPVENGLWVGTSEESMFLAGVDPQTDGGFQIKNRTKARSLPGGVYIDSVYLKRRDLAKGRVALWPTSRGVLAGDGNGSYVNITGEYWVPPAELPESFEWEGFINVLPGEDNYIFAIGNENFAMNLSNGAVTKYMDDGNSFARTGDHLLVADSVGVHVLDSNTDNRVPIAASFSKEGIDFDNEKIKKFVDIYFHMKSDGNLSVTVSSETGSGTVALVDGIDTMHGSKADLPRGVKGRNIALAVSNVNGSFFEIADMDVITEVSSTRRGRQTGG